MAKVDSEKKQKTGAIKRAATAVRSALMKVTAPVRGTRVWKWLRKYILRSPFNGYFVDSFKELKQVTWPDRKTSIKLTFVVILFSVIFSAFTTLLDVGFENLAKQIFLN